MEEMVIKEAVELKAGGGGSGGGCSGGGGGVEAREADMKVLMVL